MTYEIVTQEEIIVAGKGIRTNNAHPDMGQKIQSTWQEFYEKVQAQLQEKEGAATYGVYDHYESDAFGDYDFSACARVTTKAQPAQIEVKVLPAGAYARFYAGTRLEDVAACWMKIWQTPLSRMYDCDYEVYEQTDGQLQIYIYLHIQAQ